MKTKFNYKYMNRGEFIRTIFSGERNLSRILLHPYGLNLGEHPYFSGFQAYLEEQEEDLKTNPIRLEDSTLTGLKAPGLYFPFTRGRRVNFEGVDLSEADLTRAYFRDSDFSNANLTSAILNEADFTNADLSNALCVNTNFNYAKFRNADLTNTNFKNAILIGADFRGANLDSTNFDNAKLAKVNLKGAKNLEKTLNLNLDSHLEITVGGREAEILSQITAANHYSYLQGLYQ